MNTPTTAERKALAKQKLLDSFAELRSQPELSLTQLTRWIEKHLNAVNKVVTGNTGREIYALGYACDITEENGTPFATISLAGNCGVLQRQPIKIERLKDFFPDVSITAPVTAANLFRADLLLDLTKWEALIPECLNAALFWGYVDTTYDQSDKQHYINEAEVLRKHFYPQIPAEVLVVAATLGYVDVEPDVFRSWIEQHTAVITNANVDLPYTLT